MADISSFLKTRVSSSDKTDHPKKAKYCTRHLFNVTNRFDIGTSYGITNHKNMPWYMVSYLLRRWRT